MSAGIGTGQVAGAGGWAERGGNDEGKGEGKGDRVKDDSLAETLRERGGAAAKECSAETPSTAQRRWSQRR